MSSAKWAYPSCSVSGNSTHGPMLSTHRSCCSIQRLSEFLILDNIYEFSSLFTNFICQEVQVTTDEPQNDQIIQQNLPEGILEWVRTQVNQPFSQNLRLVELPSSLSSSCIPTIAPTVGKVISYS